MCVPGNVRPLYSCTLTEAGGGGGGGRGLLCHKNNLEHNGQSLGHNRIKTRELENSIIGKNWSIMWQGLLVTTLNNSTKIGL